MDYYSRWIFPTRKIWPQPTCSSTTGRELNTMQEDVTTPDVATLFLFPELFTSGSDSMVSTNSVADSMMGNSSVAVQTHCQVAGRLNHHHHHHHHHHRGGRGLLTPLLRVHLTEPTRLSETPENSEFSLGVVLLVHLERVHVLDRRWC